MLGTVTTGHRRARGSLSCGDVPFSSSSFSPFLFRLFFFHAYFLRRKNTGRLSRVYSLASIVWVTRSLTQTRGRTIDANWQIERGFFFIHLKTACVSVRMWHVMQRKNKSLYHQIWFDFTVGRRGKPYKLVPAREEHFFGFYPHHGTEKRAEKTSLFCILHKYRIYGYGVTWTFKKSRWLERKIQIQSSFPLSLSLFVGKEFFTSAPI